MNTNEKDCCFINGKDWFRYRTAAIIMEEKEALFVGTEGLDYLYTIGGGVHMGETAETCVKREVFEETGVPYEIERLVAVCENFFKGHDGKIDGLDCHCIELIFLMKSRGSRELHSDSYTWDGEREKMHWIPLDKLENYNIKPSFLKDRLKEIVEGKEILHIVTEDDR